LALVNPATVPANRIAANKVLIFPPIVGASAPFVARNITAVDKDGHTSQGDRNLKRTRDTQSPRAALASPLKSFIRDLKHLGRVFCGTSSPVLELRIGHGAPFLPQSQGTLVNTPV
jgi:hypothetical protein